MYNESINSNTHFLLVQLLSQIADLGKGSGLSQEVAKAVYPLIYTMNNDKSKNLIDKQLHNFQKQLPKEFKIALNKIRTEYLSNKLDNLKDPNQRKEVKIKEKQSDVTTLAKDFIKSDKKLAAKSNANEKKAEIKKEKNVLKKEQSIKKDSILKTTKPLKENFQKMDEMSPKKSFLKQPLQNKKENLVKKFNNVKKEDNDLSLKNHTIEKRKPNISKNNLKTTSFLKKEEALLKIIKTSKELQKTISIQKQEQAPVFKPQVPLTLPFVTFHRKEERIETNTTREEKFKLQRVGEIEATGEDKDESKNNK